EFYKLLVKFVAGVLPVTGIHPAVNQVLSAIAFTSTRIEIDEQLSLTPVPRVLGPAHITQFVTMNQPTKTKSMNHLENKILSSPTIHTK
ncbi:MAG TPA: hypothetical protein VMW43_10980, partial [Bacteroidota bacterium]|nr:hypothetical protein [Bacteroidota bacterium]